MRPNVDTGFVFVYLNRLAFVSDIMQSMAALHNRTSDRPVNMGDLHRPAEECAMSFVGVGEYASRRALELETM